MMKIDKDLLAIQEVRNLVAKAKEAQKILDTYPQEKIDEIVKAMADEAAAASEWLARIAVEETDIGVYEDKIIKNLFAAKRVYETIKDLKTVGFIKKDEVNKVYEIAEPVGVIAALTPTTNPTSTAIFKSLISVKARNAIVFSPHPRAADCTSQAVEIMHKAAIRAGAPEGILGCISTPTLEATQTLLKHPDVNLILATGGSDMVKAAYSAGKPAYGVGPGNVPAYIERSANIRDAVKAIIASKTFDNGTICASEQAVICDRCIAEEVKNNFTELGGVFLNPEEIYKLEKYAFRHDGSLNPAIVGKSAVDIAEKAGIKVPKGTRVLLAPLSGVGKQYPLSKEKLSPILAYYEVEDWKEACQLCIELLNLGGLGHSMSIHSNDEEIIKKFALEKPAFRILVNQPSSFGAIGATTGLVPSLTLGCGTWGGNATSDNVGPMHLMNIKRVAYGVRSLDELKATLLSKENNPNECNAAGVSKELNNDIIKSIVEEVLKRINS